MGFIVNEESTDINIHDTYYVIMNSHLCWLYSIFLMLFFIIYGLFVIFKLNFNPIFSKVHIFGTLISVLGVLFPYSLVFRPTEFPLFDNFEFINLSMAISILVFLMLQILFIINIFVILTKRFFNKNSL